jgi:thioredoxin-like negative regulator of GroEL
MERLQSRIEKCIAGVAMNNAAREEKEAAREEKEAAREVKFDARWDKMFEKQEVKIDLLKTNVAAIKRKEDLALLTADTSSMCAKVKAWHKVQCDIILAEMRPPPATSTTTPAPYPPEAPNGATPTGGDNDEVEEMFNI